MADHSGFPPLGLTTKNWDSGWIPLAVEGDLITQAGAQPCRLVAVTAARLKADTATALFGTEVTGRDVPQLDPESFEFLNRGQHGDLENGAEGLRDELAYVTVTWKGVGCRRCAYWLVRSYRILDFDTPVDGMAQRNLTSSRSAIPYDHLWRRHEMHLELVGKRWDPERLA